MPSIQNVNTRSSPEEVFFFNVIAWRRPTISRSKYCWQIYLILNDHKYVLLIFKHVHINMSLKQTKKLFSRTDCNRPIGITSSTIIPDSAMTSSSFHNRHPASAARLNGTTMPAQSQWGAWCADKRDGSPYLQVKGVIWCSCFGVL